MSNTEQLLLFLFILFNCNFICSTKIEKDEVIEQECHRQNCYNYPSSDNCTKCIKYISDFCSFSFDSFCQKFKQLPKWSNESKEATELFYSLKDSSTIRFCRVKTSLMMLKNYFKVKILLYLVDLEAFELQFAPDEIIGEADMVARMIMTLLRTSILHGFDGIHMDFVHINATTIYKVIREEFQKVQIAGLNEFLFTLQIRIEYSLDDIVKICSLIDYLIIDPNWEKAGVDTLKIEIRELSKICEKRKAIALASLPIFPANYSGTINNISTRSIDTIKYSLICHDVSEKNMTFKINIIGNTFWINYFCANCTKLLDNIMPIPEEVISKMIEFALDNGYHGFSFPNYVYDDHVGECGEGKFPLLSHAARTIKKRELIIKERELTMEERELTMKERELRIPRIKRNFLVAVCSLVLLLLLAVFFHSLASKIFKETPNINKYLKDPTKILSEPNPMSEGFEAQVFRGWYTNEEGTEQQVAIKAANNLYFSDEDLYEEIRLLAHCSQPSHKNIVKLIGWYCEESVASESGYSSEEGRLLAPNRYNRIRIVTEFLEGGTLEEFLATPEAKNTGTLLNFMEQICDGMAFLAQKGLVHRDLQTSNCVLDGTRTIVKIIDFGLCRRSGQNKKKIHHNFIVKLTAPECMLGHSKYTEKSDVWSFGVLSWYLFAKTEPWADVTSAKELKRLIVHEKKQLERIVDGVDKFPLDGIYEKLIQPCWRIRPSRRPSFEELKHKIQDYVKQHKDIWRYTGCPKSSDNSGSFSTENIA